MLLCYVSVHIAYNALYTVLCCPVFSTYSFQLKEDIELDAIFADVLLRAPAEAMKGGGRIEVDMKYMFTTVHLPFDRSNSGRSEYLAAWAIV